MDGDARLPFAGAVDPTVPETVSNSYGLDVHGGIGWSKPEVSPTHSQSIELGGQDAVSRGTQAKHLRAIGTCAVKKSVANRDTGDSITCCPEVHRVCRQVSETFRGAALLGAKDETFRTIERLIGAGAVEEKFLILCGSCVGLRRTGKQFGGADINETPNVTLPVLGSASRVRSAGKRDRALLGITSAGIIQSDI